MNDSPVPHTDDERPSPISLRLVAAVVDFTIVMVLVVVAVALGEAFGVESVGNWVGLALVAIYPIVSIARTDRTIGKRICSLVVRSADGGRPGWARSVVRFAVTAVPLAAATVVSRTLGDDQRVLGDVLQVVVGGVTYLPIVFDDQRRGLHDRLAGTRVVCTAPPLASITEQLMRHDDRPHPEDTA